MNVGSQTVLTAYHAMLHCVIDMLKAVDINNSIHTDKITSERDDNMLGLFSRSFSQIHFYFKCSWYISESDYSCYLFWSQVWDRESQSALAPCPCHTEWKTLHPTTLTAHVTHCRKKPWHPPNPTGFDFSTPSPWLSPPLALIPKLISPGYSLPPWFKAQDTEAGSVLV